MGISCSITRGDILKVVYLLGFNLELCLWVYNVLRLFYQVLFLLCFTGVLFLFYYFGLFFICSCCASTID